MWFYRKGMLHAKAIIIDDHEAVAGSANMDMRSLLLNYEVGLLIDSRVLVRDLDTWMQHLLDDSLLRRKIPGPARGLLESVARLLAPLL